MSTKSTSLSLIGLFAGGLLASHAAMAAEQEVADVVVRSARVITVDPASRIAEAVAIRGGRIVAVGRDDDMDSRIGPMTKVIEAEGKVLLPGLYDSHVHPLPAASSEADHEIPAFESLSSVISYIASRVRIQPKNTWIVVKYAFPTRLREGRFPTKEELDKVAPDHMVLHQGGPAGVVNSLALRHSGINRDTPNPPAGSIVRDPATGEPTGMMRNAYSALKDLPNDAYSDDGLPDETRVLELLRQYNRRGLTSIADRGASGKAIALYRQLRDRKALTIRVNATRILEPPFGDRAGIVAKLNSLANYGEPGEPTGPSGVGDHWVRIGPLKVFLDGGMLNGTAYMREPWGTGDTYQITEPDYRGLLFVKPEILKTIAQEAATRGWQMTAHCAGEAGMDRLLDAYEQADQASGIRNRRWMITHANFTSAENLRRCAELGVGADIQPAWLWKDTRTLMAVLGSRRMEWFHPYRKWLDAGVTIGGGSDHMIRIDPLAATNPWDPWLGIWIAVTRQTEGSGVLNPDQKLSRADALRFYTINNAKLHFEDKDKGTIEEGKLADLILVDRDPLTCPVDDLRSTKVLWTMVDGRIVYESDSPNDPLRKP